MFKNRLRHKKLTRELCANRQRFYKLAYSWTADPMLADDLVQEAMQKAILSFDSLKDDSKLNAWTCRILMNCHRDWLRRRKDTVDFDDYEIAGDGDPQSHVSTRDTSALVRQCIARLSEKHRTVITLVDLMEFSYEEVSQALEIPIGTVMSRLCRARRQLNKLIAQASDPQPATRVTPLRSIQ